jgi:hypothetical protein
MTKAADPNRMSRDERIHELAAILAKGVIRLLADETTAQKSSEKEPHTRQNEP